ncbi:MAG: J domain-containing protein [Planctomyces sp.]|nr:J domain-containing protein [Planctomyces sp.]
MAKTLYEILGVQPDASLETIQMAYMQLSEKYQGEPADSESTSEGFLEIQLAFESLSDPQRREEYDLQQRYASALSSQAVTDQFSAISESVHRGKRRSRGSFWRKCIFVVSLLCLVLFGANRYLQTARYGNSQSGIRGYTYGADWIRVHFDDGDIYEYRAIRIGQLHINTMKRLADSGQGLNTYINKNRTVWNGWSKRITTSGEYLHATDDTNSATLHGDPSSTFPRLSTIRGPSLTGRWLTTNGDSVRLIELGDTIEIELLESSTMSSGNGVLTRNGNSLNGRLTGYFYSSPSTELSTVFVGTVIDQDYIEYTVDVVEFFGTPNLVSKERSAFSMTRIQF